MSRINECALALTLSLTYGMMMGIMGLLVYWTGYGKKAMHMYSDLMPGYEPTPRGSLIGAVWGALIGGIMGLTIGALYNFMEERLAGKY